MALITRSAGNREIVVYGATEATDNSLVLPATDFGVVYHVVNVNALPLTISVASGGTIEGGNIVLARGEWVMLSALTTGTWRPIYRFYKATTSSLGGVLQADISTDTAASVGATYDQAEVQAILDELRDLKTKMRAAGLLAT